MLRKILTIAFIIAALAILASTARADGIIIPVPPPHIPPERVANLAIRYHRVKVTIEGQIATTEVDQVFVNESPYEIEGIYIFPLPEEASISEFSMFVDGTKLTGRLLEKEEARDIYEDIVRKRRDPALLEYVGRNAFRASIYPIPAKGEKRVVLRYSELLRAEQGLVRYLYPLNTEKFSSKPIEDVSIHVDIRSPEPLKAIYSPSHDIALDRDGDYHAQVGYEERHVKPDRDFELYYSTASEGVGLHVLSYKERGEDGFFLLLAAPKVEVRAEEVVAKDVTLVLDISGSMRGAKLDQAKAALEYVLDHLNEEDRFNIVAFSTGTRAYSRNMEEATRRDDARRFVRELQAGGGTNINRAFEEALRMASGERPQIIIFLTDGLATEGVVETDKIIANVAALAPKSVRIFTFGIGDEVNTVLLDTIAERHRGASAYVRPNQSIKEVVSAFYAKVGTPLLADLQLDFGNIAVEDMYPYPLPDLYVGSQLVLVGRYRTPGTTDITLQGKVNDRPERFVYRGVHFRESGGEAFIPVLWATRKIGYLLTQIRLHGEDRELVDEIVSLSTRYGIMTPYTSFLVDETEDVLTQEGRARLATVVVEKAAPVEKIVKETVVVQKEVPVEKIVNGTVVVEKRVESVVVEKIVRQTAVAGAAAVDYSIGQRALKESQVVAAPPQDGSVKQVGDRAFILRNNVWTDTRFDPSKMQPEKIRFGSEAYFALLEKHRDAGRYLALGERVIVVLEGRAYEISPEEGQTALATPSLAPSPSAAATPTPRQPAPAPTPSLKPWQRLWHWLRRLFQ